MTSVLLVNMQSSAVLPCYSVCDECKVEYATLYQSPDDPEELLVVGVNAEKAKSHLASQLSKMYPEYTIATQNIEQGIIQTKELAGSKSKSRFKVTKSILQRHTYSYVDVSEATCELILQAEIVNSHHPYSGCFAHLILDASECERLVAENAHEDFITHMQQNVAGKSVNTRYTLKQVLKSDKTLDLRSTPPMFMYRHYRQGQTLPVHYGSFLADTALLQIEHHQLSYDNSHSSIQLSELSDAMAMREEHAPTDVIFPLRDPKDLAKMALKRVRIRVGPSTGYMILGGIDLQPRGRSQQDTRHLLHHLQFMIEDW